MLNEKFVSLMPLLGYWRGAGTNRDQEPFTCRLHLEPAIGGNYLRMVVDAQVAARVAHAEETWIYPGNFGELEALQFSLHGGPRHLLLQQQTQGILLTTPNPEAREAFRESILLQYPSKDDSWRLVYSWGQPGDPVEERSHARMARDPLPPVLPVGGR